TMLHNATYYIIVHLFALFFFLMIPPPPKSTLFPYTTLFRSYQSPCAVVQFQCRISQCIGNIIWRGHELGTNGTNNHLLWSGPLHNETANHHVVACLNQAANTYVC